MGGGGDRRGPVRWALLWLAGSNCRAPLLATGPLLPLIVGQLHLTPAAAGALTALPLLTMAAGSWPGGVAGDRLGARWLLVAAQAAIAVFGACRALAAGAFGELAAAAAMGGAIGVSQPALVQMARGVAPRRPALAAAVATNGFVVGSLAAGALTVPLLLPLTGGSWRGAYLAWAVWGALSAVGWMLVGAPPGSPPPRTASPGGWRAVAGVPGLLAVAVVFALENLVFYALATWLPTYFVQRGWPLATAAQTVTALALGAIAGALVAPPLLRWGGFRRALGLGALGGLGGMAGILWWPHGALAWAFLVGLGDTIPFTLGMSAPALLAPGDRVGAAAGLLLGIGYLGSVLGPGAVGLLTQGSGRLSVGMAFLVGVSAAMVAASGATPAGRGAKEVP